MEIIPSLLSVPYFRLNDFLLFFQQSNMQSIHIDIMDGHFVPNLAFCPRIVTEIKHHYPNFFLDVHIMGNNLEKQIPLFKDASKITIHIEAAHNILLYLKQIKEMNIKAGVAINPNTDIKKIDPFYSYIDSILLMSVYPGFSGKKFIPETLEKIKHINCNLPIYIDGGINRDNFHILKNYALKGCIIGSGLILKDDDFKRFQNRVEKFRLS